MKTLVTFVDDYQEWAKQKWFAGANLAQRLEENEAAFIVASFGVGGESGEFLEKVKKQLRGDVVSDVEIIKELGDILYYIAIVADAKGYTLSEVFEANIKKLDDRQNRQVLQGSGDNR